MGQLSAPVPSTMILVSLSVKVLEKSFMADARLSALAVTLLPALLTRLANVILLEMAYDSSTYPIESGVFCTAAATPWLPLPPMPLPALSTGHSTEVPAPTLVFQSALKEERALVKISVVA